jgi:hypothetical protein
MKTLLYTSIYSNLWGTEFGGRSSRNFHYKSSLYNILNLNPDKVICFTSTEELPFLEEYFYNQKKVDRNILTFMVFDLTNTKYFNQIRELKNLEEMKKTDRCYEIQYNKFFWLDLIPNIETYDRVFWIDAGLSHSGLFPTKYSFGLGQEQYYFFNLFNKKFLDKLNNITELKPVLVGKNNQHQFFWSQTIPNHYYTKYNNDYHVIGGFFGGKYEDVIRLRIDFEKQLMKLLQNEKNLYMEEQILSWLYSENSDNYELLKFDDWYKRENHIDGQVRYFYNIFEGDE